MIEDLLIRHEGLRLKPYLDTVGKLTIGVGRNLTDKGISREEALLLLHNDLTEVRQGLDQAVPWWTGLSEPRRAVLESMAFNLGLQGLLGFTKFLAAVNRMDWEEAARQMLDSRWATQVGDRVKELAQLMQEGDSQ